MQNLHKQFYESLSGKSEAIMPITDKKKPSGEPETKESKPIKEIPFSQDESFFNFKFQQKPKNPMDDYIKPTFTRYQFFQK